MLSVSASHTSPILSEQSTTTIKVTEQSERLSSQDTDSCSTASASEEACSSMDDHKLHGLRSSIKISSLQEDIPVHPASRRQTWKMLPVPDMEKIRRRNSVPTTAASSMSAASIGGGDTDLTDGGEPPKRRSVVFLNVEIRSHAQTLGDNPSVSYGPPIQLDWQFEDQTPTTLDDFEANRGKRRPFKELGLNYYYRMNLLEHICGHSKVELKAAQKKADRDKIKRSITKYFLPILKLEDAAESGLRKTKRVVTGGGRRSSVA